MSNRWALSFLRGEDKFNYRVAGIVIRDGHVLVCREDDQDYVFLPGGRVEFGEVSEKALEREIDEELHCSGEVGNLLFSVENFFELSGEHFHELAKYYALELPVDFPFVTGKSCRTTFDEGHELTFYWVAVEGGALDGINLLPKWIRGRLGDLPLSAQSLIEDER
ncbi:MAG: NUDIX domain-containing protein [Devosiaceae bacterium]|nr:NUDIX domain-containing protein [Devosiaceae bacterium]